MSDDMKRYLLRDYQLTVFGADYCLQAIRQNACVSPSLCLPAILNDIGKAFLRSAEVPNAEPEEGSDYDHREDEARNI